jgi:hypothetical protein
MITLTKLFQPAQLTASVATYYTVPANKRTQIKKLTATNPTSSAAVRVVTVHLVPSGGTASDTNMIISARPVAVGQAMDLFEAENHILLAGDTIQAFADAATDVSFQGSGIEVT